ncbi:MAG: hypothetical protein KAW39_01135 [Thermoplasmata archaeon]|nr:hypothetical protein [Thermoplasmata archaeon]
MPKTESVEINLKIPLFGGVKWTWTPNDAEREAAWELYVELVTRISVVELKGGEGILREALGSLYSVFSTTRGILRSHGPEVAKPRKKKEHSLGELAIIILNYQLRPLLAEWHPRLMEYESKRSDDTSAKEHEDKWECNDELRERLDETRRILIAYSDCLARIANVEPLYEERAE